MSANDPREAEALVGLLQPLLKAFEMLFLIARHFHPPRFEQLMAQVGTPDNDLRAALANHADTLAPLGPVFQALDTASDAALQAYAVLRQTREGSTDVRGVYRAFRPISIGLEALYPLAAVLPPVSRFFLDPALRSDATLLTQLSQPMGEKVGVMHFAAEGAADENDRGGFWLYVPENYTPERHWPLVVGLHGGSGTGRQFLWSWLRDARSRGAILAAPTSVGATWALSGPDEDSPNLAGIVDFIRSEWQVDETRMMLSGMSDGGTFTYVSALEAGSPFTHLAPVAAAFHPLLAEMIEPERIRGLPIHITHGALDWMFPAAMAREAQQVLSAAGASVVYREIEDLSHTYPREMNAVMLDWLAATAK